MIVENRISIAAPAAIVWQVTEDVERWPAWTPTVTSVKRMTSGPFGPGSIARIKQPAQPESEWVVTEFTPGRSFSWETRRRGLRMVGSHEIVPTSDGSESILRVEASGLVGRILWPILRPAMAGAIKAENRGLKARCEQIAAATREGAE